MKLIFVELKTTVYGGQKALLERCIFLEKTGIDYAIFHPYINSEFFDATSKLNLTHRVFSGPKVSSKVLGQKIAGVISYIATLLKISRKKDLIIHLDSFDAAYIALGLKFLRMIASPIVFTIRSDRYFKFTILDRVLLSQTNQIITNSNFSKRQISKSLRNTRDIKVHYSPIDFSNINTAIDSIEIQKNCATRISYVGAIEPRKNLTFFIEVALKMLKARSDIAFHIFGTTKDLAGSNYLKGIQELIPKEYADSILFRGYVQIETAISESDILFCPFDREPLGRVVAEFLYFGRSVVVSDNGGMLEAGCGFSHGYKHDDLEDCIATLTRVIDSVNIATPTGTAKEALEQKFSSSVCTSMDISVYKNICQQTE